MKKIKNVDAIANGAGIIGSACVGYTLSKVIAPLLPSNMRLIETVIITIGTGAIGGYVGGKIGNDITNDTKIILETINEMIPEDQYVIE